MKRIRAAWFAFRNPEAHVCIEPGLIKIHNVDVTTDMAEAIRKELLKLKRRNGGVDLGLS